LPGALILFLDNLDQAPRLDARSVFPAHLPPCRIDS